MAKKCIICGKEAGYRIKDTSDYYCQECAEENFADIQILIKLEKEARNIKSYVTRQMNKHLPPEDEDEE